MIDKHRDVLEEAKSEYHKMKKAVDELRASEVLFLCISFTYDLILGVYLSQSLFCRLMLTSN